MATRGIAGQIGNNESLVRIPPFFYLHALDCNTNVTRLEIGPKTYIRQDNERVVFGPERMITVPPRHYCIIENPVVRSKEGEVVCDEHGQPKLAHADQEIRVAREPFPLYPGETLKQPVTPLKVVLANHALRLKAVLDIEDETGEKRTAGDEWLFEGPGTYIPRKEVVVEETIVATVIKPNQAIKLRARKECLDRDKHPRVTGEEWLVKKTGAYLPGAYEEVVDVVNAFVLTEKKALHMLALRTFKDDFGIVRKNGEEWLIKMSNTETHIPNVYEEVVGVVNITTLTNRQYCVIMDPVDDKGIPQLGRKKLMKGEKSFFLMPGESLEKGIQNIYVLGEDEGLILRAKETFTEDDTVRKPGDRWMIRGPVEYVPSVEIEVVTKRSAIPLDDNEGIYIRNIKTGNVRAVTGETYMLNQDEELWEKELPQQVEQLLALERDPLADRGVRGATGSLKVRDKTRVITYRVPHNAAVQIYDYKEKKARVVFARSLSCLVPMSSSHSSVCRARSRRSQTSSDLCVFCWAQTSVRMLSWWRQLITPGFNSSSLTTGTLRSSTRKIPKRRRVSSVCQILSVMRARPLRRVSVDLSPRSSLMTSTRILQRSFVRLCLALMRRRRCATDSHSPRIFWSSPALTSSLWSPLIREQGMRCRSLSSWPLRSLQTHRRRLLSTQRSAWSRRRRASWRDRRSTMRQRLRSPVGNCLSCRLTAPPWRALDRPRLRLCPALRLQG